VALAAATVTGEGAVVDPGAVGDRTTGAVRSCGVSDSYHTGAPGDPDHDDTGKGAD
jgi:hypothetical protein